MSRDVWLAWKTRRRFGLLSTVQWVLLVVLAYIGVLQIWNGMFQHKSDSNTNDIDALDYSNVRLRSLSIPVRRGPMSANQTTNLTKLIQENQAPDLGPIAVLVFCATRPAAIGNHLRQLVAQRPSAHRFPIVVSQDGDDSAVAEVVRRFVDKYPNITLMQHTKGASAFRFRAYRWIAAHYKWAIGRVADRFSALIVTEDDLDIGPDFFSYFEATRPLLDLDPSVWCISAWNDNGGAAAIDPKRTEKLYRTDFFPGLGWMMKATLWRELAPGWPEVFWDDHMRRPEVRKDRVCIRPEVPRTRHNNRLAGKGSSNGQFKQFLEKNALTEEAVDFALLDLTRLTKPVYDPSFRAELLAAQPVNLSRLVELAAADQPQHRRNAYRVRFADPRALSELARHFGLMHDVRSGLLRTSYYGVITFFAHGLRVHAIHNNTNLDVPFETYNASTIYDPTWDRMAKYLDFANVFCTPKKWTGKCDPNTPEMKAWLIKKNLVRKAALYKDILVF